MTLHRTFRIGVITALAITLTGCGAPTGPAPEGSPTTAPWNAPLRTAAPADDAISWTSQTEAIAAGEAIMHAFLDRDHPQSDWWASFSALLTPDAKYAWEGTDPRNIPATALTGTTTVVGTPSSTSITLRTPTDAGAYELQLTRRVEVGVPPGPWLLQALTPPPRS